jgi:hypothetical protein
MLWFRAHRYGWGWSPSSWQGWAVTGVWAAAFCTWLIYRIDSGVDAGVWFLDPVTLGGGLALIAALFVVCRFRGERPRWRWGK